VPRRGAPSGRGERERRSGHRPLLAQGDTSARRSARRSSNGIGLVPGARRSSIVNAMIQKLIMEGDDKKERRGASDRAREEGMHDLTSPLVALVQAGSSRTSTASRRRTTPISSP